MNLNEALALVGDGLMDKEVMETSPAMQLFFKMMNYVSLTWGGMGSADEGAGKVPMGNGEQAIYTLHALLSQLKKRDDPIYKNVGVMEREIAVNTVASIQKQLFG